MGEGLVIFSDHHHGMMEGVLTCSHSYTLTLSHLPQNLFTEHLCTKHLKADEVYTNTKLLIMSFEAVFMA